MAPDRPARPARARARGSLTLVSLCLTTVLGIALGSYLALCTRSYELSTRQFNNDRARDLVQAGLEEALWALNQDDWASGGPASGTAWATSGANRTATFTYASVGPGATGQVDLVVTDYAAAGPAWPAVTATATVTLGSGRVVTRTLQAAAAPTPLFANAIASADSYVFFTGGGTVDSWDSDPDQNPATPAVPYSFTAGNPPNYAAVVAGRDNGTHGVVLTQAQVRGYVATFGQPVAYSISGSPPGRVLGPATPAGVAVDSARLGRSAFVPTTPVFTITLPPSSGPNYGGTVNNILDLVNALAGAPPAVDTYETSGDLTILGVPLVSPSLVVDRPLKLIVAGSLTLDALGKITITPTGSLTVFVADDVTIRGQGFDNQNVEPAKCVILATSSSTSNTIEYDTPQDFRGVIYSENKPIDVRQDATFYGALLSRQYVRFTAAAPVLHYDLALRRVRFPHVRTPYVYRQITGS